MGVRILLLLAVAMGGLAFSGASGAEENRIDCFEACDTKMMGCLKKCPQDPNGDFERDCRNVCAVDTFHPCLDRCPHPRTGLTPAQKRAMQKLQEEAKDAAAE
ncbi:MAG: hypothetical protein VX546_15305 [Myxococcota bacterium]|nr:hypothetical protein [Myxococcota bacterium]